MKSTQHRKQNKEYRDTAGQTQVQILYYPYHEILHNGILINVSSRENIGDVIVTFNR